MSDSDRLTSDFATQFPAAFAKVLADASPDECSRIVGTLPPAACAAVVSHLPAAHIDELLKSPEHAPGEWLEQAPFDDAVNLLNRMPRDARAASIEAIQNRRRRERLLQHQRYPLHSVGAIVSDLALRIDAERPAADVLAELRGLGRDDPGGLIVVDDDGHYVGLVNRWRLMLAHPVAGPIRQYLVDVPPVYPETSIVTVAQRRDWHTRNWLAVVDHDQLVLGGVSRQAVFRAAASFSAGPYGSGDLLLDLLRDASSIFGRALESALLPRRPS